MTWRQGRSAELPDHESLTPAEERARIYIGKGFRWLHNGQHAGVLDQFIRGLQIAPELEFDRLPGFWDLPREGHNLAVTALSSLGRARDAARLQAIVDRRFRPRLVSPRPNRARGN